MRIIRRAILYGITLMLIGVLSALAAAYYLEKIVPTVSHQIGMGLSLFVVWLVLGGTLRSIYRLQRETSFFALIAAGTMTTIVGLGLVGIAKTALVRLANIELITLENAVEVQLLNLGLLAVLLSFFITINIKIKNRFIGNLLELLLLFGTVFLLATMK